jgi:hypothetical protein
MEIINDFIRLKGLSSRMIGEYRLITEQSSDTTMAAAIHTGRPGNPFDDLKKYIKDEVYKKIKTEKKMQKIIRNSDKEQGSLSELLFPTRCDFPKQTVLIRFGSAVEAGVRKYIAAKYEDISDEISPLIKQFLGRHIQLDVAARKDNTYFISELKYNFNLDTEKTAKIVEKLDLLSITLKKFYGKQGFNTSVSLVSLRYPHADDIVRLNPDFKAIKGQYIFGYVDFFKLFNLDVTKEEWESFHKALGNELQEQYSNIFEKENNAVKVQHAN